jgi:hypothetical protein
VNKLIDSDFDKVEGEIEELLGFVQEEHGQSRVRQSYS